MWCYDMPDNEHLSESILFFLQIFIISSGKTTQNIFF